MNRIIRKFIESGVAYDGTSEKSISVDIPAGPYQGLLVVVKGTTDTAQAVDLSTDEIARMRLERKGSQKHGEKFNFYHKYADHKYGYVRSTTPTAGATRVNALIPFQLSPSAPNIMDSRSKEEVDLYIDFVSLSTLFGANTVTYEVYGLLAPHLVENYELEVVEQNIAFGGAGSNPVELDGKNIAGLILESPSSIISKIQVEADDSTIQDNIDVSTLEDFTLLSNNVEADAWDIVEIPFIVSSLDEARNNQTKVTPTATGSGTLNLTKLIVNRKQNPYSRQRQANFMAQLRASTNASKENR